MEFFGEYRIAAPQQRVWEALNDPAILKASIAGCQSLEKTGENSFAAIVTTKVGPISATFRGSLEFSEIDAPNGYTLTGRGQGGAAGFAKMSASVGLRPDGESTILRYTAGAEVGGKLASVGSRLIQSVAKKNADDFFLAFARQLTGETQDSSLAATQGGGAMQAQKSVQATPSISTGSSGYGQTAPAWLVVFGTAVGVALGYCLALVMR
ncbi:SRPBCC family protein [Ottowia thiooxydans]|uniref:SRPBCC family protein n=1 Tax=Ottowia thiooxydans TaxID=219182 RepID=UPI00040E6B68|nr:carbon monoxide dehydrogenase subunit G [Ottowia thiooxydans]